MAARRPDARRKPEPKPAPASNPAGATPSPRVGMLNKLGNAHWGVAFGMGLVLLGAGIYTGETFALVYGGIMMVLGLVLRQVRRKR